MLDEEGAGVLAQRLATETASDRVMSDANYVEAGTVMAGRHQKPMQGLADLDSFLLAATVDEALAREAIKARIRYGKEFGAAAGLNFGDCFAYALAKRLNAPLLYVGADFAATDLA